MTEEATAATLVRAPNHLGDVVLALPALARGASDVMVVRGLAPVLHMAGLAGEVLPLDRGPRGFARAVRRLRKRGYRRGVLMSAAFSAAWLFRCGGVRKLRGTRTDGRGWLLRERVEPETLRGLHRVDAFALLMGVEAGTPLGPARLAPPEERTGVWRARLGGRPLVGIFPGANAPARRWPAERFAHLARDISARGAGVVVLGGTGERDLTARVAGEAGGARDLGGRTDLVDLAAILSLCDLVITNDTGPMHLAGAVGTPTVSLWGASEPAEVRQTGAADLPVTGAELPCKPCHRNHCDRSGRGTLLADAHVECMKLIEVHDVLGAAREALDAAGARE